MERYEDLNLWMKSSTAQIKKNLPGFTAKELYNKYYPDELQLKANTKEKQKLKNFKEQLKRQCVNGLFSSKGNGPSKRWHAGEKSL